MRYIFQLVISFLFLSPVFADDSESGGENEHGAHGPHHFSVLVANTHERGAGDSLTVGLDYEYRVNKLLGVGVVAERAYGSLDATTVLAVADIHFQGGLIMQVGPGFERRHDEEVFVARVGVLYEFEVDRFTLSPQLHWDYHNDEPNTVVAGVAFGFSF